MGRFVFGLVLLLIGVVLLGVRRALRRKTAATDLIDVAPTKRRSAPAGAWLFSLGGSAAILLGTLTFLSSFVRVVPANTVGIPTTFGKVGKPLAAGFHVVEPWTEVTGFSTRMQELSMLRAADEGDLEKDDSVVVIARGGGSMKVDITVRFSLQAEQADQLFKLAGSLDPVKERFVRPDAREVTRNVFGGYTAEEGYSTKRPEIATAITTELRTRLAARGILVDSVNVRDVGPEQQVLDAINAVLQARNEAARASEDQKKQVTEAETRKQVAALDKEATVTKAEADAQAVTIAAEAQAEANAKIAASLTPELLELEIAKACADAIATSPATVINVCGNGAASTSGAGSPVIVDARPTTSTETGG